MSYANAAAKNAEGGGARASSEFLEGSTHRLSDSRGQADQVHHSVDVDSGKVSRANMALSLGRTQLFPSHLLSSIGGSGNMA